MHAPSLEFFSFVILGGLLGSGSGGTVIRESATPGDGDVTVRRKNDARDVVGRDRIRRSSRVRAGPSSGPVSPA